MKLKNQNLLMLTMWIRALNIYIWLVDRIKLYLQIIILSAFSYGGWIPTLVPSMFMLTPFKIRFDTLVNCTNKVFEVVYLHLSLLCLDRRSTSYNFEHLQILCFHFALKVQVNEDHQCHKFLAKHQSFDRTHRHIIISMNVYEFISLLFVKYIWELSSHTHKETTCNC